MRHVGSAGFVLGLSLAGLARGATATANQFLKYVFGGDGIQIEKLCWPNDDTWMLHGGRNPAALAQLAQEKIPHRAHEVVWTKIDNAVCLFEVRDGKVDPAFMLEQVYQLHRQVVTRFLLAVLAQDRGALQGLATNPENVAFGRALRPSPGDMDVYGEMLARLPIVRVSSPAADKASRSITYRVPLGAGGLALRLVKSGRSWLVETGARVEVPFDFLFM